MREAAVIVNFDSAVIHKHVPEGRTGGSLPDHRPFWDAIWALRKQIAGIAHSHPGSGIPSPSHEDITTFAAIEQALGRRLAWPIVTSDCVIVVMWDGRGVHDYATVPIKQTLLPWITALREISEY